MESMHPKRSERVQHTPSENVHFFLPRTLNFLYYKFYLITNRDSTVLCCSQISISFNPYSVRVGSLFQRLRAIEKSYPASD
jgi:hypothetical protein